MVVWFGSRRVSQICFPHRVESQTVLSCSAHSPVLCLDKIVNIKVDGRGILHFNLPTHGVCVLNEGEIFF